MPNCGTLEINHFPACVLLRRVAFPHWRERITGKTYVPERIRSNFRATNLRGRGESGSVQSGPPDMDESNQGTFIRCVQLLTSLRFPQIHQFIRGTALKKLSVITVGIVLLAVQAFAADGANGSKSKAPESAGSTPFSVGVGVKVSTLGIGGDIAVPVTRRTNARFGFNAFN